MLRTDAAMMWREGTLMKLKLIVGRVFNRIKDFMA